MKIVNPALASNIVKFIPRRNDISTFSVLLINELTKVETSFSITPSYLDGIVSFSLVFDFSEGDKYEFKCFKSNVSDLETVYYRGKIFATAQEPQNYQLSKDLYFYE